eukprot:450365-Rhodomonas_salina.2
MGFEDSVWTRRPAGGKYDVFKQTFLTSFDGMDKGAVDHYLRCEVIMDRKEHTTTLQQKVYAQCVLHLYCMWGCTMVKTPLKQGTPLSKKGLPQRRSSAAQADLSFAYLELSKFVQFQGAAHLKAAECVLQLSMSMGSLTGGWTSVGGTPWRDGETRTMQLIPTRGPRTWRRDRERGGCVDQKRTVPDLGEAQTLSLGVRGVGVCGCVPTLPERRVRKVEAVAYRGKSLVGYQSPSLSAGGEFCVRLVSTCSGLMLPSLPVQGESESGYVASGLGPGSDDSQGSIVIYSSLVVGRWYRGRPRLLRVLAWVRARLLRVLAYLTSLQHPIRRQLDRDLQRLSPGSGSARASAASQWASLACKPLERPAEQGNLKRALAGPEAARPAQALRRQAVHSDVESAKSNARHHLRAIQVVHTRVPGMRFLVL